MGHFMLKKIMTFKSGQFVFSSDYSRKNYTHSQPFKTHHSPFIISFPSTTIIFFWFKAMKDSYMDLLLSNVIL
jgi:hypothetical protein